MTFLCGLRAACRARSRALQSVAQQLHRAGLIADWRNEASALLDEQGVEIARCERGAFRTLDGTTLITLNNTARTFEVNSAGTVIWDRTNTGLTIARAPRYRMVNGAWVGP